MAQPPGVKHKKLINDENATIVIAPIVADYLEVNPPVGGLNIEQIKADTDIADSLTKKHSAGSDDQDLSGKVDEITGHSLVADTEIVKIHAPGSDDQDLSGKSDIGHTHPGGSGGLTQSQIRRRIC